VTTSASANLAAKEVFDLLRDDLLAIEQEFQRDAVSGVEVITEIGEYLREGGGKRIRPALLLLAAKLCGYEGRGAVRLGSVVEIVHTATLVHDDIIDEALTRRGRPSANTKWGNSKCVLAGDWLYMQAFRIALEEQNFRVLDLLIGLTQQMVEGELMQMERLGRIISQSEHLDLIYRKTACLFSVSMRLGAVLGHANDSDEDRLGKYGRNLGLAHLVGRALLRRQVDLQMLVREDAPAHRVDIAGDCSNQCADPKFLFERAAHSVCSLSPPQGRGVG